MNDVECRLKFTKDHFTIFGVEPKSEMMEFIENNFLKRKIRDKVYTGNIYDVYISNKNTITIMEKSFKVLHDI